MGLKEREVGVAVSGPMNDTILVMKTTLPITTAKIYTYILYI